MNQLLVLKNILNTIDDDKLKEFALWIDNSATVKFIAVETNEEYDLNNICLITEDADVKINGKEW